MNDIMYIPTLLEAFVGRIIPSPFNYLGTIVKIEFVDVQIPAWYLCSIPSIFLSIISSKPCYHDYCDFILNLEIS